MHDLDYSRQTGAVDLEVLAGSHLCQVGVGSGKTIAKAFTRMGISRLTVIDPDKVEFRNVTSQGFTHEDARLSRAKVDALARECLDINPKIDIQPIRADFMAISDGHLKKLLTPKTILIMSTDFHPAQARGALAGLVCSVPTILASLYREGKAGEIVFVYPGRSMACYRCITRSRYDYVARGLGGGTGNAGGSLPFSAQFVDSIVGHLAIGLLHKWRGANDNRFARWIDVLGQRSFIQSRLDPGYHLAGKDIFGDALGRGDQVFAFDSIWQSVQQEVQPDCPDCHGHGALSPINRVDESTELEARPCGCLIQMGLEHSCQLAGTSSETVATHDRREI